MIARYLPLLLLLLNACTDGNEDASLPDRLPKNRQYTLAEGQPPYIYNSSSIYTGYRLQFTGDSVRMYEPFGRYSHTFRAYEADSTARFADSTYLTYAMAADSSLNVVVRDVGDKPFPQRYVLTERLDVHALPRSVDERTYEFSIDGVSHLFYFQEFDVMGRWPGPNIAVFNLILDSEEPRLVESNSGFGMPVIQRADTTVTVNIKSRISDGRPSRGGVALIHASASGEPRLYLKNYASRLDDVSGPHTLVKYPSPVPKQLQQIELLDLLNRGRISTRKLNEEPDSVGIKYAYEADFSNRGGIEEKDIDKIDFEFRADSTYSVFLGSRELSKGHWELSADRNFIKTTGKIFSASMLKLIHDYESGKITFPITLDVKTRRPKGVELLSYYEAEVMVSFELDGDS